MESVLLEPVAFNVTEKESKKFLMRCENLMNMLLYKNYKSIGANLLKIKDPKSIERIKKSQFFEHELIILMLRYYREIDYIQRICLIFIKRLCYKNLQTNSVQFYRKMFSSKIVIQHIRSLLKHHNKNPKFINLIMQTLGNISAGKDFMFVDRLVKTMIYTTIDQMSYEDVLCSCLFAILNISKKGFEYIRIINRYGGILMTLEIISHSEKKRHFESCFASLDLLSLLLFDHAPIAYCLLKKVFEMMIYMIMKYKEEENESCIIRVLGGTLSTLYFLCARYEIIIHWISEHLIYQQLFELSFKKNIPELIKEYAFLPLKSVILKMDKDREKKIMIDKIMEQMIENTWRKSYERVAMAAIIEMIDYDDQNIRKHILEGDGWAEMIKRNSVKEENGDVYQDLYSRLRSY